MKFPIAGAAILMVSALFSPARGQGAAGATTAPAYRLVIPPGMQEITVGSHTAICSPEYAAVTRAALGKITPVTRPTTMASDMLEKLVGARQTLVEQISSDCGLSRQTVSAFLDGPLKNGLIDVRDLHANAYVMVATEREVSNALRNGWHAPMFHYNETSDRPDYEERIAVGTGHVLDDVVLWTQADPGEADSKIIEGVISQVHNFEGGFAFGSSQEAMLEVRTQLVKFLSDDVFGPLQLRPPQQWLALGMMGALSAKYAAELSGVPRQELEVAATLDSPNNPIKAAPLDLLHEFDPSVLKPQFLPYYLDAVSRKGTMIAEKILDKAGDSASLEIINSIRQTHPQDNAALIKIIKDDTGIDVTSDLLPPQ